MAIKEYLNSQYKPHKKLVNSKNGHFSLGQGDITATDSLGSNDFRTFTQLDNVSSSKHTIYSSTKAVWIQNSIKNYSYYKKILGP